MEKEFTLNQASVKFSSKVISKNLEGGGLNRKEPTFQTFLVGN